MSESIFLKFGFFRPHEHICHLYSNESECLEIGTKFMIHGIKNRNKCIFITDGAVPSAFNNRLIESGFDIIKLKKAKDLEQISINRSIKEAREPKEFAKFLNKKIDETFNKGGYTVRILISNKYTYLDYSHTELLLKKILLEKISQEKPVVMMNQYKIDKLSSKDVINIFRSHSNIVLNDQLYESPLYQPPKILLKELEDEESRVNELTPKEKTILRMIVTGLSNKTIAKELSISVKTVETHRANIMNKLDIHKLVDLVKFGIRNRII